jgi:hypothetical protein
MQQQQKQGTDIIVQGRIVWGGVKAQTKKVYGTQTVQLDPKTGKEVIEYAFGLAIPKINAQSNQHEQENFQKFWNAVHHEAAKVGFQQGAQNFHWKFDDGDGRKQDGSEYPTHSKGHYVIACKTRLPLKLMAWEGSEIKQITEDGIKCGDYVQVSLNINAHGNPNAGLYINPSYVARFAYGEAIINTPDPKTVFGNAPPPMPFGGSATPMGGGIAPVGFAAPSMGGYQQPQAPAPVAPQQYQPNHAVLPGQFGVPAQGHGQMAPSYPQNSYGNAGPNMGQGQAPTGMPMQGMPGQPMNPGYPPGYNGQ